MGEVVVSGLRGLNPEAYDRGVAAAVAERDDGLAGMKSAVAALEAKSPAQLFDGGNGEATLGVLRWGVARIEAAQAAERGETDG
ncbi:MAG TPA: hypothetical protein VMX12_03200 [Acidimicrobiia bacterium]|nr:hypothetical protein [Acidimicrobiia bacterium]